MFFFIFLLPSQWTVSFQCGLLADQDGHNRMGSLKLSTWGEVQTRAWYLLNLPPKCALAPNSHLLRQTFGPNLFITFSKTEASQHKTSSNKNIKKLHKLLEGRKSVGSVWEMVVMCSDWKKIMASWVGDQFHQGPYIWYPFLYQMKQLVYSGMRSSNKHTLLQCKFLLPSPPTHPKKKKKKRTQVFLIELKLNLYSDYPECINPRDNLQTINPDNPDRFIFSNDILDEGVAGWGDRTESCLITNHIT